MSTYEPLSYDSLKSVLRHMDPNLRLQISDSISSIRAAEKATPLFIEGMWLRGNKMSINKTLYSVHVIRQYLNGLVPDVIGSLNGMKMGNGIIKVPCDLNGFSGRDWTTEDQMTPGDLIIEDVDEDEIKRKEAQDRHNQLQHDEFMMNLVNHARLINNGDPSDQKDLEQKVLFEYLGFKFTTHLQVTIENPTMTRFERFACNKTVPEVMKYLTNKLLGGRKYSVRVGSFAIEGGIFRLPEDLKLKVEYLEIGHNSGAVMNSLGTLIDERSLPLKRVYIDEGEGFDRPENYNHPWIQTTEYLEIRKNSDQGQWLPMLLKLSNQKIYFTCEEFLKEDFIAIINHWLEYGRKIGAAFTICNDEDDNIGDLLAVVEKRSDAIIEKIQSEGCPTFPNVITLPMKNNLELCVYCEENAEDDLDEYSRWELNCRVIAAQHRQLWNVDFYDALFD